MVKRVTITPHLDPETLYSLYRSSADVAREFHLNKNKRMLLVLDQAGWHCGNDLKIPESVDLLDLPAYSPELQPGERLWPLVDEVVANNTPQDLNELSR
jgi:hypothetical protein